MIGICAVFYCVFRKFECKMCKNLETLVKTGRCEPKFAGCLERNRTFSKISQIFFFFFELSPGISGGKKFSGKAPRRGSRETPQRDSLERLSEEAPRRGLVSGRDSHATAKFDAFLRGFGLVCAGKGQHVHFTSAKRPISMDMVVSPR